MSIQRESNSSSVSLLLFSGRTATQLNTLFDWLDLVASEQPKIDGNKPPTRLTLNAQIHEVRKNPADRQSQTISLIAPETSAKFEFIRLPITPDREKAKTIAHFTFTPLVGTKPQTISGEIQEEPTLLPVMDDVYRDLTLGTDDRKVFSLHEVDDRLPATAEEREHAADLLDKLRMIINQLFFKNSLQDIICSYQAPEEVY